MKQLNTSSLAAALVILCAGLFMAGTVFSGSADAEHYQKAYQHILEEQWENAYHSLTGFIHEYRQKGSRYYDDARFWQCYALDKMGENEERVFECYETFIRENEDSKWTDDARSHLIEVGRRLVNMGKTEYEAMLRTMEDSDDDEIAMTAIMALRNINDENSADALIALYDRQDNPELREKILFVLGDMNSEKTRDKLMAIARSDSNPQLRKKALFWLGDKAQTDETLHFLESIVLTDADRDVREHALFAISESPNRGGIPILKKIAQSERDPLIRKKAVFWLGDKAETADIIEFLESVAINDPDQEIREHAVFALSEAPDSRGIPSLMRIARNQAGLDIRKKAIFWIGQHAETGDAVEFLKTIALSQTDFELREQAVFGLSEVPGERGLSVLIEIARTGQDSEIRKKAIFWLGQNGHSKDVLPLLEFVIANDPDFDLKKEAIFALGQMPQNRGIPILIRIAKSHPDQSVRKKAIFWLGESDDSRAREALVEIINYID